MARSLNKASLIGNLTRDPELRYTPQGAAVCTFGLATNRQWTTESGEKKEDAEFHRIVAWNKLAELCSQLLSKGRKVFVEGRLQTRKWQGQDGNERTTTEIVITEMIILDSRPGGAGAPSGDTFGDLDEETPTSMDEAKPAAQKGSKTAKKPAVKKDAKAESSKKVSEEEEDIPF